MEADEAGTIARLRAVRAETVDPLIAWHRGRVVKLTGDGALVAFESVVDAVRCAVRDPAMAGRAQRRTARGRADLLRIGINLGDVRWSTATSMATA